MLLRYFKPAEFACKCGCGTNLMDSFTVQLADEMRHTYGKPMVISSGYRCPKHNAAVSSTGTNGPHTTGKAFDVLVDRENAYWLMEIGMSLGFTGIGVKQHGATRYLHFDRLTPAEAFPAPRPTIWSYP